MITVILELYDRELYRYCSPGYGTRVCELYDAAAAKTTVTDAEVARYCTMISHSGVVPGIVPTAVTACHNVPYFGSVVIVVSDIHSTLLLWQPGRIILL